MSIAILRSGFVRLASPWIISFPSRSGAQMNPRILRWHVGDAMNAITTLRRVEIRLRTRICHCFTRCGMCGRSTLRGHRKDNGLLAQLP